MQNYKIFLTDLTKYANGSLNGEWVTLPHKNIEEVINKIIPTGHEHFISDYDLPFEISEHENIIELNEFIIELQEAGLLYNEIKALFKCADTIEEGKEKILNGDYSIIETTKENNITNYWECGYILYQEGYMLENIGEIPEKLMDYMDWDHIWNEFKITQGWEYVTVYDHKGNMFEYIVNI